MKQFTSEDEKSPSARLTNRKIFLPGEKIPEGFIDECKKDEKGGAENLNCQDLFRNKTKKGEERWSKELLEN